MTDKTVKTGRLDDEESWRENCLNLSIAVMLLHDTSDFSFDYINLQKHLKQQHF